MKLTVIRREWLKPDALQKLEESEIRYRIPSHDKYWYLSNVPYGSNIFDYMRQVGGVFLGRDTFLFPATEEIATILCKKYKAVPSVELFTYLWHVFPKEFAAQMREMAAIALSDNISENIDGLRKPLRKFQAVGVAKMNAFSGRALLADEMGLGKTAQAIAFATMNKIKKVLVVCPANLKLNWLAEIKKWTYLNENDVYIIEGTSYKEVPTDRVFYVINYDIMYKWRRKLNSIDFNLVILDEAHHIKNSQAERAKATLEVAQRIKYVLALTGTPILNRVVELWNILNLLKPDIFAKKSDFLRQFTKTTKEIPVDEEAAKRYLESVDDSTFNGIKNAELLKEFLEKHVMIRRTKKEVLPELPPKNRIMVMFDLDEKAKKEYRAAEEEFNKYLTEKGLTLSEFLQMKGEPGAGLALIEKMRQIAVDGKLDQAKDFIENFLETNPDEKIVVFAHHTAAINKLMNALEKNYGCVKITGSDSAKKRQEAVEKFQGDNDTRVIIVSITAGGEGITLTRASNAVVLESDWSPGRVVQAEDRLHRIGQEADSVTIYHLLAADTIDIPIYNLLAEKQELIDQVMSIAKTEDGMKKIDVIRAQLNQLLEPLGLQVVRINDPTFTLPPTPNVTAVLPPGKWLTLSEAEEYAKQKGSKIRKQHLWWDIRKNKLKKDIDVVYVEQAGGPGKVWWINIEALERRINERKRGRGRPPVKTSEEKRVENEIKRAKDDIKKSREVIKQKEKELEKEKKRRPL